MSRSRKATSVYLLLFVFFVIDLFVVMDYLLFIQNSMGRQYDVSMIR